MQQHNLSWTQPCTMSDGNICSDDEKYGGIGAMMANSLRCQEERQEEREQRPARSRSVFATKTANVAASRAPVGKNPPLVTLINESKTTSGKRVVDDITLAAARAPAKKVAPSASAPDLAPAPVFLDNLQATAAVKANLVEIVGSQMSCRGRSCEEDELCGDEVLKEDVVVRLRTVQLVVDGKEEKAIEVVWVTEGMDCCRVGFLPRHMVRHAARYNGVLAQVTRVFNGNPADCSSKERRTYHIHHGFTEAVNISDLVNLNK
jgi:hypothetical protein